MKRTRLTNIPFLTVRQYEELVKTGSTLVNGELKKKEDYQFFIVPDTGESSGGGAKLYVHEITIAIDRESVVTDYFNDNAGCLVFRIVSPRPTEYFPTSEFVIPKTEEEGRNAVYDIIHDNIPLDYATSFNGFQGFYTNNNGAYACGWIEFSDEEGIYFYGFDTLNAGDLFNFSSTVDDAITRNKRYKWSIWDSVWSVNCDDEDPIEE